MTAGLSRSFAELLRSHRVAAGLSQDALAERANISLAAVAKLERGARQRPYRTTVALLADALSLPAGDRFELERAANRAPAAALDQADESTTIKLPLRLSSFVGRERDLKKIIEMLETERLVTLVGAGGIGKTRLALSAAERFVAKHSGAGALDAAWFVDFSMITDGATITTVIASSVGLNSCRRIDALVRYLRSHKFLLIADNCEHLLPSVGETMSAILSHCPDARILVTSRQSLSLEGEHVYRVLPMSIPDVDAVSANKVLEFDAIRLFRDRARAIDSRFELDDYVTPATITICRQADGIPLCIELAAARTNAFSVAAIAEQLRERLSFLTVTRTPVSRHNTMSALFDWSYELLDPRERELFRRASIFAGGFTLNLLQAQSREYHEDDIATVLGSLVDKSLIECDVFYAMRYRLLEPARQYAREKLRQNKEYDKAARLHALALLAVSEDFDARLELIPDHIWNASIELERDNFRAAFDWALGPNGSMAIARRLAASRTATWSGFGTGEVRKWLEAVRNAAVEPTEPSMLARLAIAEARAGVVLGPLQDDDPDERVDACRRALALQMPTNRRGFASAKHFLGEALRGVGRYDEADSALRDARAVARSEGAQYEYAAATIYLGAVRYGMGDIPEARALSLEAVRQGESAGAIRIAMVARANLAEIEFASGFIEESLRLNELTMQHYRDRSNLLGLLATLCNSAACLIALKRYQEARDRAAEALQRSVAMGNVRGALWAMQHLAAAAVLKNHVYNEAIFQGAAQLVGFIDEMTSGRAIERSITEQQGYDQMIDVLSEALGEDALRRYIADGKTWVEERAVEEALTI